MATKTQTIVTRTSDISDAELSQSDPRVKIVLTVDGEVKRVELDMTADELATLRDHLAVYFAHGVVSTGSLPTGSVAGDAARNAAIRKWAKQAHEGAVKDGSQGYVHNGNTLPEPGDKGRLARGWVEAYDAWQKVQTDDASAAKAEGEPKTNGKANAPAFKAPAKSAK